MRRAPSLRRRLLAFLVAPMVLAWLISGVLVYVLALHYANVSYDRALIDALNALERMVKSEARYEKLNPQTRILFELDTEDPNYYAIRSLNHGTLSSNLDLPLPDPLPKPDAKPHIESLNLGDRSLRMASLAVAAEDPGDLIVVSVAQTLRERRALAREILVGVLPIVLGLIVLVLVLVWFGVNRGLHLFDPLTTHLAGRRARDLSPLDQSIVPVEIRPLTRTVDLLLARLRSLLDLQDRFIADAAHQLRTPLAGLRLQAERALADPRPDSVREALIHVERLSAGAGRAAGQLLALARTQSNVDDDAPPVPVDLARLARDHVAECVPRALAANIDLGYAGPKDDAMIAGDAVMLREALVNLVDNALNHVGAGGSVTVEVARELRTVSVSVEDDGPGVSEEWWPRLGERFFRAPGAAREGSGLGLAIVRRIAERHHAALAFARGHDSRGLRVTLRFSGVRDC
ncbi:MAG TPA: sensor histidine kinase N-terminal domain-containing protein [Rhodanobacteraceae bacterium]|nr:sensor histidine kinase N-terminal domain-containing protein [Rhodanobacteraceae bacterium]